MPPNLDCKNDDDDGEQKEPDVDNSWPAYGYDKNTGEGVSKGGGRNMGLEECGYCGWVGDANCGRRG